MRKSKDPLSYFTIKLTDEDYARVAQAAAVRGVSIGEIIRRFVRALPEVEPLLVERWRKYRKRGGSEKVAYGLEEADSLAAGLIAAGDVALSQLSSMADMKKMRDEVIKEELAKEAHRLGVQRVDYDAEIENMTLLQQAELQQMAEEGKGEEREKAKEMLARIKAYKKTSKQVEL